jgi:hypothetical protein
VLCWGKADRDWLYRELDALNRATVSTDAYDVQRAIYLKSASTAEGIGTVEGDRILHSDAELDSFLNDLQPKAEGTVA